MLCRPYSCIPVLLRVFTASYVVTLLWHDDDDAEVHQKSQKFFVWAFPVLGTVPRGRKKTKLKHDAHVCVLSSTPPRMRNELMRLIRAHFAKVLATPLNK